MWLGAVYVDLDVGCWVDLGVGLGVSTAEVGFVVGLGVVLRVGLGVGAAYVDLGVGSGVGSA